MNQNDICVQRIDPRRKHGFELYPTKQLITQSAHSVDDDPKEKLQEMRARNFGNTMPHYKGSGFGGRVVEQGDGEMFYVLRVQVDLASMVADQPLEQFGERPLGAVAPVDKRR